VATCLYVRDTIAAAVAVLQRTVAAMTLARYSNLPQWTRSLDSQVLSTYLHSEHLQHATNTVRASMSVLVSLCRTVVPHMNMLQLYCLPTLHVTVY
jgi:hypothetical protein